MPDSTSHPTATAPKKTLWERVKTSRFLVISIAFHLLLILIAGILVVQVISTKRKLNFAAAPAAQKNRAVEHQIQMVKKNKSMSAPMTKRVVTTGLSKVALPAMPEVASANISNPVPAMGAGAAPGIGTGTSMGGGGGGGAGGAPLFGFKNNRVGFEGTIFDLKQTRSHQPAMNLQAKPWENERYFRDLMATFADRRMTEGFLGRYYRGKDKLYTSQIIMPRIPADEGPKSFGVDKDVAPGFWLVVYKAKVSPPKSGTIRFVGSADDVMLVKFNNRIVLDGSLYHGVGKWKAEKEYNYANYTREDFIKRFNKNGGGGWARGDAIKVEAGKWYDMVIAIGEAPGGFFDASLMIEEEGVTYQKDDRGNPILPPFRLGNVKTAEAPEPNSLPPLMPDGPIWKSKSPSEAGSFLDGN